MESSNSELTPSVVCFALILVFIAALVEYTNVFDSWLSWVVVLAVLVLVGYDAWLRVRVIRRSELNHRGR